MFTQEEKVKLRKIKDRSMAVVHSAIMENGALLASPPGERFPYVYPRDTALILRVLINLGEHEKAREVLQFLARVQSETGEWAQRYDRQGKPASYKPPQLDGVGLILYTLNKYAKASDDKEFLRETWQNIKLSVQYIIFHYIPDLKLVYSINGLHEWPPMEAGFDLWANVTSFAGIKAALEMAEILGKDEVREWEILKKDLWQGIINRLVRQDRFIKLTGSCKIIDPDVTEFAPYITESLPMDDLLMKNTADFIINKLWNKELGGIERCYIRYAMPARDNGGHGPYSQYTGWVGQYSTDSGDYSMVKKCTQWFMRYSRDGLIPEHVSTKERFDDWVKRAKKVGRFYRAGRDVAAKNVVESKEYQEKRLVLWVIPLVWGHAEFLNFYHKMEERRLL